MQSNNSGYIVELRNGLIGRTYHSKGTIRDKVPVFIAVEFSEQLLVDGKPFKTPLYYAINAILCSPKNLKIIGNID